MGDLSANFSRHEFACKCGCGFDTVDYKLVRYLESVRRKFGKPVTINSGARCPEYNKQIGGSPRSQHLYGRAADIAVGSIRPDKVADFAENMIGRDGGVGRYNTFTHIDSRGTKARWDNRK